jgi:hypothetical protein
MKVSFGGKEPDCPMKVLPEKNSLDTNSMVVGADKCFIVSECRFLMSADFSWVQISPSNIETNQIEIKLAPEPIELVSSKDFFGWTIFGPSDSFQLKETFMCGFGYEYGCSFWPAPDNNFVGCYISKLTLDWGWVRWYLCAVKPLVAITAVCHVSWWFDEIFLIQSDS